LFTDEKNHAGKAPTAFSSFSLNQSERWRASLFYCICTMVLDASCSTENRVVGTRALLGVGAYFTLEHAHVSIRMCISRMRILARFTLSHTSQTHALVFT